MVSIYIFTQKSDKTETMGTKSEAVSFTWKYEKAESLNLDGMPNTNVFLTTRYANGKWETILIDTTAGSCNDLPDREVDSALDSTVSQCYAAGLGFTFKVTKGEESYLVMRKEFEEGSPDYTPPKQEYKVIAEIPLTK